MLLLSFSLYLYPHATFRSLSRGHPFLGWSSSYPTFATSHTFPNRTWADVKKRPLSSGWRSDSHVSQSYVPCIWIARRGLFPGIIENRCRLVTKLAVWRKGLIAFTIATSFLPFLFLDTRLFSQRATSRKTLLIARYSAFLRLIRSLKRAMSSESSQHERFFAILSIRTEFIYKSGKRVDKKYYKKYALKILLRVPFSFPLRIYGCLKHCQKLKVKGCL